MATMKTIALGAGLAWLAYLALRCGCFSGGAAPRLEPQWWGPGTPPAKQDTSVRSIKIHVPDDILQDLNRRLANTRFSSPPLEGIHFQYGFNSITLEKIVNYWRKEYKWRERETYLNKYPHFKTNIQGLDLHFLHVKPSKAVKTVPLLLLHGWPGSVREFYPLIELLTRQERLAEDGFALEIIVPSLPGYGWSAGAVRPGLGTAQMAVVFKGLMERLGHDTWYVQGGDWGSQIASHMSVLYPQQVLGLHMNLCFSGSTKTMVMTALASVRPSLFMEPFFVKRNYPMWERFTDKLLESGYLHIQATKPDTVATAHADSPAGLAAYILEKFSTGTNHAYRDAPDGGLTEKFTYDDLLDNVMIYWLTNSMTTAVRLYAENFSNAHRALGIEYIPVQVRTWCARFPGEIYYQPDWMLRHRYPQLRGSTDMQRGGHFAAMEEPQLLAEDIVKAVRHFEREIQTNAPKKT